MLFLALNLAQSIKLVNLIRKLFVFTLGYKSVTPEGGHAFVDSADSGIEARKFYFVFHEYEYYLSW
jgi:hypothetical protein